MTLIGRSVLRASPACCVAVLALSGCDGTRPSWSSHPDDDEYDDLDVTTVCDSTALITPDSPALLVTDPAALAKLPLEDVLERLLEQSNDASTTPLELLQRMFDSNNAQSEWVYGDSVFCDLESNPAHVNGPAAFCPRAEGALARSDGFFTPGHPDHFYPVAAVNRLDLMPSIGFSCGEARIVYAKESGRTDPEDRVFLIFELSVPNPSPGEPGGCGPMAEIWRSLEDAPRAEIVAERLRDFFFEGPKGITSTTTFAAPLHPANLGLDQQGGATSTDYYGTTGQIRVSQHMEEHWEMRQMVASLKQDGRLRFVPTTVGNNPLPGLFEPKLEDSSDAAFAQGFMERNLSSLAAPDIHRMTMTVLPEELSGESALGGEAVNDYAARGAANPYLQDLLAWRIEKDGLGANCPEDDPLTPDSILRRATMQSCAGCHAPAKFLGPERKVGCGQTWPASLGEVHIDEKGRRSPALETVFLPHRADVMTKYLRTCHQSALRVDPAGAANGVAGQRTLGGSATH